MREMNSSSPTRSDYEQLGSETRLHPVIPAAYRHLRQLAHRGVDAVCQPSRRLAFLPKGREGCHIHAQCRALARDLSNVRVVKE